MAQLRVVGAVEGLRVAGGERVDDGCGLGRGGSEAGVECAADGVADGLGEVVVEAGAVAVGAFGGLVLGHAADGGAEVGVPGEFGELDPGVDLLGFGVVGEFGYGRAEQVDELGVGVQAAEGVVDEVGDQAAAFVVGELCELVHEVHFLGSGVAFGHRAQHRAAQAEDADLHVQGVGVRGRDLGHRDLPVQHLPDGGKVEAEVAQGAHQVEARERVEVVEPVAGRAAVGRRHDPGVRPEPDGLDRQPGAPGQVADREEHVPARVPVHGPARVPVHAPTLASPPAGDSRPPRPSRDRAPVRRPRHAQCSQMPQTSRRCPRHSRARQALRHPSGAAPAP